MTIKPGKKGKQLSTWLLRVTMVLSLFAFSGNVNPCYPCQNATPSALVVAAANPIRSVATERYGVQKLSHFVIHDNFTTVKALSQYNRVEKIRFIINTGQQCADSAVKMLAATKHLARNEGEGFIEYVRG